MRVCIVCLSVSGAPGECYYNDISVAPCNVSFIHGVFLQLCFIIECGTHAFSVLCVYSKFGHHPHHLGYLCAKSRFFCGLHCWASPWVFCYCILAQSDWQNSCTILVQVL